MYHLQLKKSRIRETKHLSTDADSSTDAIGGWTKAKSAKKNEPKNWPKNGQTKPNPGQTESFVEFWFENCLKSPRKKKFFSSLFSVFFGFWSFITVFLPPLPEVGCPIFLEIWNPWGKVLERSGLRYEHFCLKIVENRRAKKSFFSPLFSLFFDLLRFSVFFNGLFAPTSRSRMSNIFRDSESLGNVMERSGLRYEHFCLEVV